jgi:hypothetical protein
LTKTRDNVKLPLNLKAGEYAIFDFSKINVGFIEWRLKAFSESDIIIGFSEFCHLEDFHYSNINAQNVIESVLPGGIELENSSFEPYSLRFAILLVKKKVKLKFQTSESEHMSMICRT